MRQYYIYDGQTKKGPFGLEQLKSQILNKETPVWYEGLTDWLMAGNIDELKEFFTPKIIPPLLPKTFQKNIAARNEILNSFTDATELYPETKRRRFLIPVLVSILIIAGIIITLFFYRKIIPIIIMLGIFNN
jgi:uncharacterized membrane protein YdbT with pleckstrin-like domain